MQLATQDSKLDTGFLEKPETRNEKLLSLRPCRNSDFEELWRLDQQCFPPGIAYSRFELMLYLRRRGAIALVGEEGKSIVGFIVAERQRNGRGHIITIDTRPEARRRGLGSELLRAAEAKLRDAGCRDVRLETAVDNEPAIAFYKRHGYAVVGTIPRYYATGVDALVMTKALA